LTAIGTLVGVLSLGLYFAEKTFDILKYFTKEELNPEIAIELDFPYEKIGENVVQNKRNPKLTITNRSSVTFTTIAVDVTMFVLSPNLERIDSAALLNHKTHGHLIFQPEFKPGQSLEASLTGVKNWTHPAAYNVKVETVHKNKKLPKLSILFLANGNSIKGEFSSLSSETAQKIRKAIGEFLSSKKPKKTLNMTAPIDNVWVPKTGPNTDMLINEDGTITIK
jgi:hypothetical protein